MKEDYSHLKETAEKNTFSYWQEVNIVVFAFTDLGAKVAINNEYVGLIYKNEIFSNLELEQELKAFVKLIREDGKIDLSLQPLEGEHIRTSAENILKILTESGGSLSFNDKSSPLDIQNKFQISKKVFKKALGTLYKQRKIVITESGIKIANKA